MTTKSDFTEEEWTRVVRAPLVAGLAISLADPGGPIEMAKESMASLKNATNPPAASSCSPRSPSRSRAWRSGGRTP